LFVACRPSFDVAGRSVEKTSNSETKIKTGGYTAVLRTTGYDVYFWTDAYANVFSTGRPL